MNIKMVLQKNKHFFIMLAILIAGMFSFAWVSYQWVRPASNTAKNQIVNDEYSVLTQRIIDQTGIEQKILVPAGTKLYGIVANFHTYNRVCFGTIFVEIKDENGTVLASSQADMTTLLDNTFKGFVLDQMLYSNQDQTYTLHIYTQPQSPEDKIALWKSEQTQNKFTLQENGTLTKGTIALQYIVNHIGSEIFVAYWLVAGFLLAAMALGYWLVFIRKARVETCFAFFALVMGLTFCVFTPQRGAPDEYVHIASSYKMANTILNTPQSPAGKLTVRECDAIDLNKTANYNVFDFQETWQGLTQTTPKQTEYVSVNARFTNVFFLLYLPQTLAIILARLLGLGYIQMLVLGRAFNLFMYIGIVYLAIKHMPIYKTTLALIALLPMSLQLAGSFCYDTYVIAFSFLYIATVFRIAYQKQKIEKKQVWILALILVLLVPGKTIYIALAPLCFLLPKEKFSSKKAATTTKIVLLLLAVFSWSIFNFSAVKNALIQPSLTQMQIQEEPQMPPQAATSQAETSAQVLPQEIDFTPDQSQEELSQGAQQELPPEDPQTDILPNGDSRYHFTFAYIIKNIPQTIKLVINTFTLKTAYYLQSLIGTRLGELIVVDIEVSWLYSMAILIVLFASILLKSEEKLIYKGWQKAWGTLLGFAVAGLVLLAAIMWTPINYDIIFGIQGRYLLPVMPLFVLMFTNQNIKISRLYRPGLLYTLFLVDGLVLLSGFCTMIS